MHQNLNRLILVIFTSLFQSRLFPSCLSLSTVFIVFFIKTFLLIFLWRSHELSFSFSTVVFYYSARFFYFSSPPLPYHLTYSLNTFSNKSRSQFSQKPVRSRDQIIAISKNGRLFCSEISHFFFPVFFQTFLLFFSKSPVKRFFLFSFGFRCSDHFFVRNILLNELTSSSNISLSTTLFLSFFAKFIVDYL